MAICEIEFTVGKTWKKNSRAKFENNLLFKKYLHFHVFLSLKLSALFIKKFADS